MSAVPLAGLYSGVDERGDTDQLRGTVTTGVVPAGRPPAGRHLLGGRAPAGRDQADDREGADDRIADLHVVAAKRMHT
jgi:hypothetical protein